VVREGSRLCQLRIQRGNPQATDTAMRKLQEDMRVIDAATQVNVSGGLPVSVDLSGEGPSGIVGYRAKQHTGLIDVENIGCYESDEYWDPVRPEKSGGLVLNPGDFYILASKESISVPPDYAAEMVAYDTLVGEFRVHYAGFFDPGFGYAEAGGAGSRAVLEVRSHEVPFVIEDGQIVGRLLYERLTSRPDKLYGQAIGSSYQRQGLQLSKQFKKISR
jgi:dCTP deaminase